MIKSAEEIALIKIGAQVADLGGAACVAAIAEDVPEYDVALAGSHLGDDPGNRETLAAY